MEQYGPSSNVTVAMHGVAEDDTLLRKRISEVCYAPGSRRGCVQPSSQSRGVGGEAGVLKSHLRHRSGTRVHLRPAVFSPTDGGLGYSTNCPSTGLERRRCRASRRGGTVRTEKYLRRQRQHVARNVRFTKAVASLGASLYAVYPVSRNICNRTLSMLSCRVSQGTIWLGTWKVD